MLLMFAKIFDFFVSPNISIGALVMEALLLWSALPHPRPATLKSQVQCPNQHEFNETIRKKISLSKTPSGLNKLL